MVRQDKGNSMVRQTSQILKLSSQMQLHEWQWTWRQKLPGLNAVASSGSGSGRLRTGEGKVMAMVIKNLLPKCNCTCDSRGRMEA